VPRPRLILHHFVLIDQWMLDVVNKEPCNVDEDADGGGNYCHEYDEELNMIQIHWHFNGTLGINLSVPLFPSHVVQLHLVLIDETIVPNWPNLHHFSIVHIKHYNSNNEAKQVLEREHLSRNLF